ncbi:MAG TPA: TonB-dependent receptor [Vicinamibacterales bacterium]
MRTARLLPLLAAALLFAASPAAGQSQAINGSIEGTIKDPSGAVLPGVTVTISHIDTGTDRVVVTNESGFFRAPLLPLGTFKVSASLEGFKSREQSGVEVRAGASVVLNLILEVGSLTEVVSVSADSPVVDMAKTDVGRTLNEREIKNLPLVSRNPYNFAGLEPGVTGIDNEEFGVPRYSVNGQMLRVNYQIDGNTNTQADRAGLRLMPISEVMVREVQVVSAGYAPEFGQTTGMVFNAVTPSGTNVMRGDVGYRFRTKDFTAWPFQFTPEQRQDPDLKPDNSLKIFTATVGGPILRNRLFYYAGFEYTRQDLPSVVTIDPDRAQTLGLAAQPTTVQGYRATPFYIGKLDFQLHPAHRLSVRVNTFTNDNPWQSGGGNTAIERGNHFEDFMLSGATQLVSQFGPNNLNEFRFQVAYRNTVRPPADPSASGPSINISANNTLGLQAINFGPYTGIGNDFTQRNTQILNNYTMLRGAHSYKVGFNLQMIHDERGTALPVTYTFPSVEAYLAAKNGTNPRGYTSFSQTLGNPNFEMNNATFAWFAQDDWKLGPDFKVLYGVRHDMYLYEKGIPGSPYSEKFNRDYNNLAPRLGVAWTINDRNVIRGNTGLNYDQALLAIIERAFTNSGLPARTTSFNLQPTSPFAPDFPHDLREIPPGVSQVSSTVEGMAPDFVTAKTWQNNITWERQVGTDYALSLGFRHSRGWNLPVINNVNLVGITPVRFLEDGRGVYSTQVNASTRVDPRFNQVRLVESVGESWYKGFTVAFNKRWSHGFQWALNYTIGEGIDTAPLGGNVLAIQGDGNRSDPNDLARDKGRNQLDVRHTFNASIVATSSVSGMGSFLNTLLSDNQVGVIVLVNSGQTDGVVGNRDLNLDGFNNDRPLFVARNSMDTGWRSNVDLRYSRFFPLGGNRRLELQGEFKNIFNSEQVVGFNNTIAVDVDGFPLDASGARLPASSISLDGDDYLANSWREQRKFQLGLKFYF